jgi:membrane protease YdiL (CAAX protease family)
MPDATPAAADAVDMTVGPALDLQPWMVVVAVVAIIASLATGGLLLQRLRRGQAILPARPHEPVSWTGSDVLVVLFLYLSVATLGGSQLTAADSLSRRLFVNLLVGVVSTFFGAAYLLARGGSPQALGLHAGWLGADLRIAVAALGLIVAPLLAVAGLLDRLVPYEHPIVDFLATHRDAQSIALVLVSAIVVAPLFEEFFFRRVLQGWLERRFPAGPTPLVLGLPAAAFALAHVGQGLAFVPLFLFALVLGVIARQTGSLPACILLHGMFNAVSVGLLLAQTPGQGAG